MPKEIYCISGLGADQRIFANLRIPGCKLNHVQWIEPRPQEPLDSYAARLTSKIRSRRPLFLGVSFGGMVAVEIAKARRDSKVAIVSSLKSRLDLSRFYSLLGALPFETFLPTLLRFSPQPISAFLFGASGREERLLLQQMVRETDPTFAAWAVRQIVAWQNEIRPGNVFHVHGTKDRLLAGANPDVWIEGGGHLMIYDRALEISAVIAKWASQ